MRARLGLASHLHALQQLNKGKVTTDPERHTGEGLFFSSKAVDGFELAANGHTWVVDNLRDDQAVLEPATPAGTRVTCRLATPTTRSLQELFERFTTDLAFDRSRTVVRLFEHGTRFVSRSEAKRLADGLERFREVELDFQGVEGVGPGFVDELLRVWARAHPGTQLVPLRMNAAVEFMVRRGLAHEGGPTHGRIPPRRAAEPLVRLWDTRRRRAQQRHQGDCPRAAVALSGTAGLRARVRRA